MSLTPTVSFNELKRRLRVLGFVEVRRKGSHIRFTHPDGRKTTVPDHGAKDVPKGLLQKIIRHDVGMELSDFLDV